jgi:hypothetical protein
MFQQNKSFCAVKNFSRGGIFLDTLFFAVEKRVSGSEGFESKPTRMVARSVLFYSLLNVISLI